MMFDIEPVGVVVVRKSETFCLHDGVMYASAVINGDVEDGTKLYNDKSVNALQKRIRELESKISSLEIDLDDCK